MSRILGRGRIASDVIERIHYREPGVMESMERPAVCYRCGTLFDMDDPRQTSELCVVTGAFIKTMETRCIGCRNASVCDDGGAHGEVVTPEDDPELYGRLLHVSAKEGHPGIPLGWARYLDSQKGLCRRCRQPFVWDVTGRDDLPRWVEWTGIRLTPPQWPED